jgi:integrase
MTKGKLTFILMKTKNTKIGKIYTMVHNGSVVIKRNSLKIDVPYKYWDNQRNRVKSSYPDASIINNTLEQKLKEYNIIQRVVPSDDENQCVIDYIKKRIYNAGLTTSSMKKYNTILKNFEHIIFEVLKMDSLPFHMLRDISFLRTLKQEIRKSGKKYKTLKTRNGWFNYMSVFARFVNDWNANSGTSFPINIKPFTTDIGKDPKQLASSLTHEELQTLIEYTPVGYRNPYPQTLSKNIFLFQYHTGGIRIQDALTLTNKDIMSDGFQIRIKKTKEVEKFPFCYEQVETLKDYYLFEYNSAATTVKIGELKLQPSLIIQINRLDGIGDLSLLGLKEFIHIKKSIVKQSNTNSSIGELIETFDIVEDELKNEVTKQFFRLVRKRPQSFLFPKLKWFDFSETFKNTGELEFSIEQEKKLHLAKSGHNSNLKRISEKLDIPKITGHTPRHTLANHLLSEGYSPEEIQRVLVHSSINTTKIYLKKRHQTFGVNKTVTESIAIFRKKRQETRKRGL